MLKSYLHSKKIEITGILSMYVCKYLRNVSHIKEVVNLGWCRQHTCGDKTIDFDGSLRHQITKWFNILVEILQLLVYHCTKNTSNLTLLWEGHVNEVEPALQSFGYDHSSTSRRSH